MSELDKRTSLAVSQAAEAVEKMSIKPEDLASEQYRAEKIGAVERFIKKYANLPRVFKRKALEINLLGLEWKETQRILDLGAGGGHFCYLAKTFGHEAIAVTAPEPPMFANFCDAIGVPVVRQRIKLAEPLEVLGRFDLICASRVKFLEAADEPGFEELFNKFFDYMERDVLAPGGGFYFLMNLIGEDRLALAPQEVQSRHITVRRLMLGRGLREVKFGLYVSPHILDQKKPSGPDGKPGAKRVGAGSSTRTQGSAPGLVLV